jgi:erythrin-vacuolar iron transport family protein
MTVRPIRAWTSRDDHERLLQIVQPALIGLIDGTVSTLAPIFATAFLAGPHAALLVGLAASLGAGISMGLSEALSDDGSISGRGDATARGAITGAATFLGGTFHSLPFIIDRLSVALPVAAAVVSVELVVIALLRRRFLAVTLSRSLIQVTLGGAIVVLVGAAVGQA